MNMKIEINLKEKKKVALVGTPNVGKSVIFGVLTGTYVTVSNYPGTTVEVEQGVSRFDRHQDVVIDCPGVNSLVPQSEDERVTRDILFTERPDVVVHVIDAKNIRRNLVITLQLIEMGFPLTLALNMHDEAVQAGVHIDGRKLQGALGVAATATVAVEREGMPLLMQNIRAPLTSRLRIDYGERIEAAIAKIDALLPELPVSKRFAAVALLMDDRTVRPLLLKAGAGEAALHRIDGIVSAAQSHFGKPLSYVISQRKQSVSDGIVAAAVTDRCVQRSPARERIGRMTTSRVWGLPILFAVLAVMYLFVGVIGAGWCVDFLQNTVFGGWVMPWCTRFVLACVPWPFAQDMLVGTYAGAPADHVGYGLISMGVVYAVAIVLPIVTFFFLFFGLLEDSGYLPRLAVMSNKVFKKVGLHGKAVLPMVLGLGCGTMAVMTTRILDTRRERILATLLLALGVPCSAQLGVILAMLGAISGWALLFVLGVVFLQIVIVGYVGARILPGKTSDFVLEIPPMRVPAMYNIAIKTLSRVKWFLTEAVPLFLIATFVLFVIDRIGVLARIQGLLRPAVVHVLGLPERATEAFLIGFFRRDYGAAGLYALQRAGELSHQQVVVSMTVMTLFVPCLAMLLVMIKEHGWKRALTIVGFVFPFAIFVGGVMNFMLRYLGLHF
ncbi:MAG TPA: ferrous iron transport protein B [bacterium]|nr:ferrous iron transport protein B [bacterium]